MRTAANIAVVSLLLLGGLFVFGNWTAQHLDRSLRSLVLALVERAGIGDDLPLKWLDPPANVSHVLDATAIFPHPRILLPGLRSWNGNGVAPLIHERMRAFDSRGMLEDNYQVCERPTLMDQVVCWLSTGDQQKARIAIDYLLSLPADSNGVDGRYGYTWEWALAFDLLSLSPGLSPVDRARISITLRNNLHGMLRRLDGDGPSLWHGRASLAAQAWLLAVAIYDNDPVDKELLRRAQAHFHQALMAARLTEAWPEGYNYWINNRGMPLTLAAAAYIHGLEGARYTPVVRETLRRIGLWAVYATRPDARIEALGDEGSRVDLKDETRRVIDIITQLTNDSVLATYSAYLERLHGEASYYPGYRWGLLLFNDPAVPVLPGVTPATLEGLQEYLPLAELFGAGAMNLFLTRSGWGFDETFISMRAGHTFTHHGHYDAGHFTLFKGAALASNSSTYGNIFAPHRLQYGIKTVSKNSLLVLRPAASVAASQAEVQNRVDGGQRVVMATGSQVRDLTHWRSQLGDGQHYEGAELEQFQYEEGQFAYIRSDLTGAYDSTRFDGRGEQGKVSSVVRELLYIFEEDRLFVRDIVVSTNRDFTKKWLLHTINKPYLPNAVVLRGTEQAGILESSSDWARVENGGGRLDVKRLLPRGAVMRLVGGSGYEYYVETDGIDGTDRGGFSGENFAGGANPRPWFDNARWRIEVQPGSPRHENQFLIALSPSLGKNRSQEVASLELVSGEGVAVQTPELVVIYKSGPWQQQVAFIMPEGGSGVLLVGVLAGEVYSVEVEGMTRQYDVEKSGVLKVDIPRRAGDKSLAVISQMSSTEPPN